jgi:hypothetical protein
MNLTVRIERLEVLRRARVAHRPSEDERHQSEQAARYGIPGSAIEDQSTCRQSGS